MKTAIKMGLVAPFILATGMANAAPTLVYDFTDVTSSSFDWTQDLTVGLFEDFYLFQISDDQNISGTLANWLVLDQGGGEAKKIDDMSVIFSTADGAGNAVSSIASWSVDAGDTIYYNGTIGVGNYRIDISGDAVGSSGGTYYLNGVSAVPEPSTYALMLGGLGLVGFMAARRRKS